MNLNLTHLLDKLPERIIFKGNWYMLNMTKSNGSYYFEYVRVFEGESAILICKHSNPETAAYMLYQKLVKEKII